MAAGIVNAELHGKNVYQARVTIDALLRRSKSAVRLRLIHGSNSGTAIRDMIWQEYAGNPRVLRLIKISDGVTDLVLREL